MLNVLYNDENYRLQISLGGAMNTIDLKQEAKMKTIKLCSAGSCCPVVKVMDTSVEIGEDDNTCVLTTAEWEILKEKILNKEI